MTPVYKLGPAFWSRIATLVFTVGDNALLRPVMKLFEDDGLGG